MNDDLLFDNAGGDATSAAASQAGAPDCEVDETSATQPAQDDGSGVTTQVDAPPADDAPDDALDDATSDEADEEEGRDGGDEISATATQTSATTAQPATGDQDDRAPIEREPYEFDGCTLLVGLQFLPHDGDPAGRLVVVGARNHLDKPIIRMARESALGALPPLVTELLDQLRADLPARQQAREQAEAKERAEEEARKAKAAAGRKKVKRPESKTKKDLSTAPDGSSPTTPKAKKLTPAPGAPATVPADDQAAQMLLFG